MSEQQSNFDTILNGINHRERTFERERKRFMGQERNKSWIRDDKKLQRRIYYIGGHETQSVTLEVIEVSPALQRFGYYPDKPPPEEKEHSTPLHCSSCQCSLDHDDVRSGECGVCGTRWKPLE